MRPNKKLLKFIPQKKDEIGICDTFNAIDEILAELKHKDKIPSMPIVIMEQTEMIKRHISTVKDITKNDKVETPEILENIKELTGGGLCSPRLALIRGISYSHLPRGKTVYLAHRPFKDIAGNLYLFSIMRLNAKFVVIHANRANPGCFRKGSDIFLY